ncbi:MAG: hypothetical protein MRY79_06495 [Alphaproteobacteria bacterium]|nr:hypothetical protein [Alphaproteobacteria bacterium]
MSTVFNFVAAYVGAATFGATATAACLAPHLTLEMGAYMALGFASFALGYTRSFGSGNLKKTVAKFLRATL